MVYVSANGSVYGDRRHRSLWTRVYEFFSTIFEVLSLFFTTITNPQAVENVRTRRPTTYAERNGGSSYRGSGTKLGGKSNIKGLSKLGDANCAVGGG